jgi:Ala-tRNA(Pro) deacylase
MATATWIREELDQRGIAYQEMHHPDAATAQEVAEREHVSGHRVAKVVCVLADGRPYELVLPASRRVRLDWVRPLLGAHEVRLATEEELGAFFSGCELGAIPALRHWPGVDVILDGHLCCGGDIFILGGTHRDALRMRFDDWFDLVSPRVELLSEPGDPRAKGAEAARWSDTDM